MNSEKLQTFRAIDKLDKIGVSGVKLLLTTGLKDSSGVFITGCGLTEFQADFILACLRQKASCFETIANVARLTNRIKLVCFLENIEIRKEYTLWDWLIDMRTNEDETWSNGNRPRNIGWALDDLLNILADHK